MNLFESNIKALFFDDSSSSKDNIYNSMKLTINSFAGGFGVEAEKQVIDIISSLNRNSNNSNNSSILTNDLRYYIIWFGMNRLLLDIPDDWSNHVANIKHSEKYENDPNAYQQLRQDSKYWQNELIIFIKDNIFSNRIKLLKDININNNDNNNNNTKNDDIIDKLVKYITQDINNPVYYYYMTYDEQEYYYYGADVGDDDNDSDDDENYIEFSQVGIKTLVLNRLTFAVFNYLFLYDLDNYKSKINIIDKSECGNKIFEFLWDISLCRFLEPRYGSQQESRDIHRYFQLKNECFDKKNMPKNFELFDRNNGTLLHLASEQGKEYLCKVLLNDGFDPMKRNTTYRREKSPLIIAKENGFAAIEAMMIEKQKEIKKAKEKQELKQDNDVKGDSSNDSNSTSGRNRKKIEDSYFIYSNEKYFAKHFLIKLGFRKINLDEKEVLGITHKQYRASWDSLYNCFDDDLYVTLTDNSNSNSDAPKNSFELMDNMVENVIEMINDKSVLSDDILILCFEYCCMMNQGYGKSELLTKFLKSIENTVETCLDSDYESPECKVYYYQFFKQYWLESNIWLCSNNKSLLYFDLARKTVDKSLIKQEKYIWDQVEKEKKNDLKNWDNIVNFSHPVLNNSYKNDTLRQDCIPNGIKSNVSEEDIYIMLPLFNKSNNFDVYNAYNNNIYLTQCLLYSHRMNQKFQSDVKSIFSHIARSKGNNISHSFSSGSVKLRERCVIKSSTDYGNKQFPSVAHILDFLRCSVTFKSSKDMLFVMDEFIEIVGNGNGKCIREICRIKNGFEQILKWNSFKDCNYCDIKFNVIIYDKDTKQSQICEIQFLLDWLLHAKKIGYVFVFVFCNCI